MTVGKRGIWADAVNEKPVDQFLKDNWEKISSWADETMPYRAVMEEWRTSANKLGETEVVKGWRADLKTAATNWPQHEEGVGNQTVQHQGGGRRKKRKTRRKRKKTKKSKRKTKRKKPKKRKRKKTKRKSRKK